MDIPFVIRRRLEELRVEQRDLAVAAQVTESYISQLLTRKKTPPASNRTDIYDKMETFLRLPRGELSRLADLQRQEDLKKKLGDPLAPLFKEVRALILCKCNPNNERNIRTIFEKQPFGELERLVTQKLLEVVKRVTKEELENAPWLRQVAGLSNRTYAQMRVMALEFLDTDVFNLSAEHCVAFLEPLIESWDIDLSTFGIDVILNRRLASQPLMKLEFVQRPLEWLSKEEPGLSEFLQDPSLSSDVTEEEIAFLQQLRFKHKRPTPLYFYRALQNYRDPLHFRS